MEAICACRGVGLSSSQGLATSAEAPRGPGPSATLCRSGVGPTVSQDAFAPPRLRLRPHPCEPRSPELQQRRRQQGNGGAETKRGVVQAGWGGNFGAASAPRALSLGFTSDPRISVERNAARLLGDAASLLVYQNALKGPQAQTLLRLLLVLSRGDDQLRLLEAYGEFYRRMLEGARHASWQDCLLEAILGVEDCPFAEASARASSPTAALSPHLLAAAKADLAALQRLALTESTLISWVCSSSSEPPPEWRAAAESPRDWALGAPGRGAWPNGGGGRAENGSLQQGSLGEAEGDVAPASLERAHVRKWREELGGQWAWHTAVDLLQSFYWSHGYGAAALFRLLAWSTTDKKLVSWIEKSPIGPFAGNTLAPHFTLSCQEGAMKLLLEAIKEHSTAELPAKPRHIILYGPSGMGKTHILRKAIQQVLQGSICVESADDVSKATKEEASGHLPGAPDGRAINGGMPALRLRFVDLRKETIKSLPDLLAYVGGMPQLRFVLCADDLAFKAGEEAATNLQQLLNGSLASDWPSNVLLLATSRSCDLLRSGVPPSGLDSDWVGTQFSRRIELQALEEDQSSVCFQEIASQYGVPPADSEAHVKCSTVRNALEALRL